jgi:hypothetical protein
MSSKYADEGTIAHALAAMCLQEGTDAAAYVGRVIEAEDYEHSKLSPSGAHRWMRCPGSTALETRIAFVPRKFSLPVTQDMAAGVQIFLDNVRQYASEPSIDLLVEQKLDISEVIGVEDHSGTGDVIILDHRAEELQVHDLKFGRGVLVSAFENEQMLIYAASALRQYAVLMESIKRVRMVIHQPRINEAPDEWDVSVEEVVAFEEKARALAARATAAREECDTDTATWESENLVPGEKQCKFCDAKATCPALARTVAEGVLGDFEALNTSNADTAIKEATTAVRLQDNWQLAHTLTLVPLIEDWCAAVMAHAEAKLLAGEKIAGWKVVQGKKGNRAWSSEDEAEQMLKTFRLKHDEMYEYSVISPTTAEKRAVQLDKNGKPKAGQEEKPIGAKQWEKLCGLIKQADGKPTVVPESDKRPALEIAPAADDFQEVTDAQ